MKELESFAIDSLEIVRVPVLASVPLRLDEVGGGSDRGESRTR
jgi:hypothetical protein